MKKTLILAIVAMSTLAACNNQPQQNETQSNNSGKQGSQQIAYIEIDSIMSKYTYWQEVTKLMQQREANIQKTLASKQQALQQAAANFQQGVQQNKYTQQQAQGIQASLQKQAQDADALSQRLGAEYQQQVAEYNQALADSLHHYLESFNKDKKYAMILAKQGDNILYADKGLDITDQIVKGLNKAYKGMKKEDTAKATEEKTDEKK
jgi:outer membrane protein